MADLRERYKELKGQVAKQQVDMGGTTAAQQENIQVALCLRWSSAWHPCMGASRAAPRAVPSGPLRKGLHSSCRPTLSNVCAAP